MTASFYAKNTIRTHATSLCVDALGPLYLPERRGVDAIHRDLARFPNALAGPLAAGATAALAHAGRRDTRLDEPEPIVPGSFGTWGEVEATS